MAFRQCGRELRGSPASNRRSWAGPGQGPRAYLHPDGQLRHAAHHAADGPEELQQGLHEVGLALVLVESAKEHGTLWGPHAAPRPALLLQRQPRKGLPGDKLEGAWTLSAPTQQGWGSEIRWLGPPCSGDVPSQEGSWWQAASRAFSLCNGTHFMNLKTQKCMEREGRGKQGGRKKRRKEGETQL